MGGFITAAVMVGTTMYASDQANSRMDAQAAAQNAANQEAYNRSTALAEKDTVARKEELLARFGVSSAKLKDTSQDVIRGTSVQLTALEMELAKAQSVTDNNMASKHITGRLAERMRNTVSIQGNMQKGNIIQNTEAQLKDIGNKLETMGTNVETEQMNLDIDLSNSINAANNQLVAGTAYSQSTGLGGTIAAGAISGVQAYSMTSSGKDWK